MSLTKNIINTIQFSYNEKLDISFYLQRSSSQTSLEEISIIPDEKQKNILIFSSARECKAFSFDRFDITFLNFSLENQVFDALAQDMKLSKYQIANAIIQSCKNAAIIFFLEEDIYYVDMIKMIKFLRESLESNIPIVIYILSNEVNDILYTKLLLLNCECVTPFSDNVFYGRYSPEEIAKTQVLQEQILKEIPAITNQNDTQEIDLQHYWESSYNSYLIETIFNTSGQKSKCVKSSQKVSRIIDNADVSPTLRYKYLPLNISIFPDLELYLTLSLLWKNFSKIIRYVNSIANDIKLQGIYSGVLRKIKEEVSCAKEYDVFYSSIEEFLPILFKNPVLEPSFPLKTITTNMMENNFYYYHIFSRSIAAIVYSLNVTLDRERKEKIAMKILHILKNDIGLFPIPICIHGEWQESNILNVFKHFRKNSL